jgi:hypothetical protein
MQGGLSVRQAALNATFSQLFVQRVALGDQPVQFLVLAGQTVGGAFLVAVACSPSSLFDQLADIVADNGDAIVKFGGG